MVKTSAFQRVRQFGTAYRAKLTPSDVEFVRVYLSKPEQVLFYRMKSYDQYHALKVAHQCVIRCSSYEWLDLPQLVRTALLHDLGKAAIKIPLVVRILYVIIRDWKEGAIIHRLASKESRLRLRKQLFVLLNHGELGVKLLVGMSIDDRELLEVVMFHHDRPRANESKLLPIIREIDSLN